MVAELHMSHMYIYVSGTLMVYLPTYVPKAQSALVMDRISENKIFASRNQCQCEKWIECNHQCNSCKHKAISRKKKNPLGPSL